MIDFLSDALNEAPPWKIDIYIGAATSDPCQTSRLCSLLLFMGVEAYYRPQYPDLYSIFPIRFRLAESAE
jgi:hypothetical protein